MAHDWAPLVLPLWSRFSPRQQVPYRPWDWQGLHFKNPLGLAGGVDKDGRSLLPWQRLGCGFLEVGTVTPLPQGPNPGSIMKRDVPAQALWNKMGFPNKGSQALLRKLQGLQPHLKVPLFVNIGKNRSTSNDDAFKDYLACMDTLSQVADVFVVNISSPNTKNLRSLQSGDSFRQFLEPLLQHKKERYPHIPLLVKLSPDSERSQLEQTLLQSRQLGVNGWILTNTTQQRAPGLRFPLKEGGVSGAPLTSLSEQNLQWAVEILGKRENHELLVSTGGVMTAEDVRQRLRIGADLVQCYSALVIHGPHFFQKVLSQLQES